MKLCEEQGGMKLLEMTELFNVGSESGVSRSVTRMNGLLAGNITVEKIYKCIIQDLTP